MTRRSHSRYRATSGRLPMFRLGGRAGRRLARGVVIVVRFKIRCRPDRTEEVAAAMRDVVAAARGLDGVINFDIARDLTDDDALIATEVFEDRAAMDREEKLPEIAKVIELMEGGALVALPELTRFEVTSVESPSL